MRLLRVVARLRVRGTVRVRACGRLHAQAQTNRLILKLIQKKIKRTRAIHVSALIRIYNKQKQPQQQQQQQHVQHATTQTHKQHESNPITNKQASI